MTAPNSPLDPVERTHAGLNARERPHDCYRCWQEYAKATPRHLMRHAETFFVCPTCGNKRCPKATDHRLACTGSNEPGQPGSRFL